jgi:hypothetical protein
MFNKVFDRNFSWNMTFTWCAETTSSLLFVNTSTIFLYSYHQPTLFLASSKAALFASFSKEPVSAVEIWLAKFIKSLIASPIIG